MQLRNSRVPAAVDENARVMGRLGGPVKRSAAVADELVKPVLAGRARGLAVRKNAASNPIGHPPTKQQKITCDKHEGKSTIVPARTQPEATERPPNGPRSKECEMLTEDFVADINEYLFDAEESFLIDDQFLSKKNVTVKMRSILIDWIVKVHERFELIPETLHLAVYIVDRYLERANVEKTELQLVGVCALLAAAKFADPLVPSIMDLVYVTDKAYNKKQMLRMEVGVVKAIGFDFGRPSSLQFLHSFSQKADATASIHCLAQYLAETTLVDASFSSIKPSLVAAGSLWLADHIKGSELNLKRAYSSIKDVDFVEAAVRTGKKIAECVMRVRRVGKLKAVTEKYASRKMSKASTLSPEEEALLEKVVE